jgi:hypothetical protein
MSVQTSLRKALEIGLTKWGGKYYDRSTFKNKTNKPRGCRTPAYYVDPRKWNSTQPWHIKASSQQLGVDFHPNHIPAARVFLIIHYALVYVRGR